MPVKGEITPSQLWSATVMSLWRLIGASQHDQAALVAQDSLGQQPARETWEEVGPPRPAATHAQATVVTVSVPSTVETTLRVLGHHCVGASVGLQ